MKALTTDKNHKLVWTEIAEPQVVERTQVKVKIYGTGVCGTDINVLRGKMVAKAGMALGHEAVGTVVEVGENVTNYKVGDRVVIDPTQFCGKCDYCRQGLTCYCDHFDDYQLGIGCHGTYTKYYVGEEKFMYKIPDGMNWETAALVEPLACVLNIIKQANIQPEDNVLVLGSGTIGNLCQMVCKRIAKTTVGTEINTFRNEFSKQFNSDVYYPNELTMEKVLELTNGKKFNVIIDAVGNQLHNAVDFAAKGARLFAIGFMNDYEITINTLDYLTKGISLVGTGEEHLQMAPAMDYISSFKDIDKLITTKIPISEYEPAVNNLIDVENCKHMKVMLISENDENL
ncbi:MULTISPECIES: zinc-dependent alcohol dehydrogenase [Pseudobutyrivibrio]|uniref:Alcohol dehydrogenase n=1 Tax=Pseudobutyrivibrio ruminis TaxID=46206 RepID=A0A2G3ED26_9FIRM|nr:MULTISPECIES: alcohol dehydrogenase catalytic domain-containing protein [Pseudobutyrivibrio]MBP5597084.1 alcohol dehydrogenase catalytic domain-containing protein [Pseudobutyrivibrio sp.]MBR5648159.1 alcohol dehydrogenase catalytic domain-containing protein [Pseudobutyrivibrio sp.]PHU41023.1 alcohol dehydrogenase [Pseudobutyrivibrio ruminis]